MSVWGDILDRGSGETVRKEDQECFEITSCDGEIIFKDKGRVVSMWTLTYRLVGLDWEESATVYLEGYNQEDAIKVFLDIAEEVKSKLDDDFDDDINDELDMFFEIQQRLIERNNSILYK